MEKTIEVKASSITLDHNDFDGELLSTALRVCTLLDVLSIKAGNSGRENTIHLSLNKRQSAGKYDLEEESYTLDIKEEGIEICASEKKGAFYGLITLSSLLMTYKEENCFLLPKGFIFDKAEYKWRGFLLDTCRSFYSVSFIKKTLDALALHKMNVFHWHLTDDQGWRFDVPCYPELIKKGAKRQDQTMPPSLEGLYDSGKEYSGYYTDSEIKEVIDYAAERQITVVPEVEFPGHASALLASYPELGCTKGPYEVERRWGIFDDVLCLGNEDVFKAYDIILDKITSLFPSRYIHIGGDECPSVRWKSCPLCQKRIKSLKLENERQLQSWATARLTEMVKSKNRIPIGWDEILDNNERFPLPENAVVQSWRGTEGGEKAALTGHKVIMSPTSCCYLNLKNTDSVEEPGRLGHTVLSKAYGYSPVTEGIKEENKKLIMGGEAALWTEKLPYSRTGEYLMFPRLCALSEALWKREDQKDFNRFCRNLEVHEKRLSLMDFQYYRGKIE